MTTASISPELVRALNTVFTRAYYSATGYMFESQPYMLEDDEEILTVLADVRRTERQHSRMVAQVLESLDRVPEAGAFPYWYRDLNYLTVPYMASFVVESIEHDIQYFDQALELMPPHLGLARTMLQSIRAEKAAMLEELRPATKTALEAEAAAYAAEAEALVKARKDRIAKEKAAKEAARKAKSGAAAAVAGMADPDEPGITNKEKARRFVLRMRAIKSGAATTAAPAADPTAGMPDPNEPGISNKEKAKRTMMRKRALKNAPAGGAAPAADPPARAPPVATRAWSGRRSTKPETFCS